VTAAAERATTLAAAQAAEAEVQQQVTATAAEHAAALAAAAGVKQQLEAETAEHVAMPKAAQAAAVGADKLRDALMEAVWKQDAAEADSQKQRQVVARATTAAADAERRAKPAVADADTAYKR
jgi:hypothetical protein